LRKGKVQALVLDLGLNPKWDNTHLPRVLKQLAQGLDIAAQDAENFYAYRLALLAHERQVPCALLSNFPGMLGLDEQRSKTLLAAFHAEKIFPKTDVGVEECADWIRQILRGALVPLFVLRPPESVDVIRNKGYNSRMMTYATL